MHHVLFKIGGMTIYTYAVLMALATGAGLAVAWWEGRRVSLRPDDILDATISAIIGGLVGARLEYVLLNIEYFRERPVAALHLWEGGLALHGGLLGGLLALGLYARLKRLPPLKLADTLALGFSLSVVVGWMACLFGGCAYGRMGFGLLYFNWHDIFGVTASRFAVQPLGAALGLGVFLGLWLLRGRSPFAGAVLLGFLILSGAIHLGLGFGRGDDTMWLWGWRVDQWLSLVQVIVALGAGVYLLRMARKAY